MDKAGTFKLPHFSGKCRPLENCMASAHIAPAHIEAFKPQACQVGLNQRFAVRVILCVQGYALITQFLQTKDT
jgi:hypothetical protein